MRKEQHRKLLAGEEGLKEFTPERACGCAVDQWKRKKSSESSSRVACFSCPKAAGMRSVELNESSGGVLPARAHPRLAVGVGC
eukprot:1567831-Pleurochrysis_carterae.AAC.1